MKLMRMLKSEKYYLTKVKIKVKVKAGKKHTVMIIM